MEQMTAQSVLSLAPSTGQQITEFVRQITADVEAGITNPLDLHIQLKALEKAIDGIKSAIAEHALNEAEKHGKTFDYHGCKIEIRETGTKYDYSGCGDIPWERLDSEIKSLTERRKEREAYLRAMPDQRMTMVDEATGEIMEVNRPVKTSTTGIAVTIK